MKQALLPLVVLLVACIVAPRSFAAMPPGEAGAKAAIEKSPRHGEWIDVARGEGKAPVRCYVVYPERKDDAPVVMVIHEIFGLTDWIRSVADAMASEGFIAVAPDLLSGHGKDGGGTETFEGRDAVTRAVRELKHDDVNAALDAVRAHAIKLPAANGKSATIGFCWGGSTSFRYATHQPQLQAAVVYYGTSPDDRSKLEKIAAPVLGLYGGDDARVNATIAPAEKAMKELGKRYEHVEYEGAGHGFLRQQDGRNGANQKAADAAWPKTIDFLRGHTK